MEVEEEMKIDAAARLISESRYGVVLSGAGISTESGIPDFRGPEGLWTKLDPSDFTIDAFRRSLDNPESLRKYIEMLLPMIQTLISAQPNQAHLSIAQLERMGKVRAVITQNIDNLHQKAGSSRVIEVHGTYKTGTCMSCKKKYKFEELIDMFMHEKRLLSCNCGGFIKPDVVFFGEALPRDAISDAWRYSEECDLMLVVGSSLVVYPIAGVVDMAKRSGAKIVIINMESTAKDYLANAVIHGKLGQVIVKIVKSLREMEGSDTA